MWCVISKAVLAQGLLWECQQTVIVKRPDYTAEICNVKREVIDHVNSGA
jgi:hypothetical protein